MKKVGHTSELVWSLLINLKNSYLLKKLLKWANKNVRILIGSFFGSFFAVVLFFKKNKENHLEIS